VVDATRGRYRFSLTAIESALLLLDSYRFVATRTLDGVERILFTDLVNQPDSVMWVADGPVGVPQGATVVPLSAFTPRDGNLYAGSYSAPDITTVVISLSGFKGKFFIEVSRDQIQPQIDAAWATLSETDVPVATTGTQAIVVDSSGYLWARFRIKKLSGDFISAAF
jgi:hypothetical protein